jgi:hypothetical protein
MVRPDGTILWKNTAFVRALDNHGQIGTVKSFDDRYSTRLGFIVAQAHRRKPHSLLLKPSSDTSTWRRFTVLIWKTGLHSREPFYTLSLHEQTQTITGRLYQYHFESQLVQVIDTISARLQHTLRNANDPAARPELNRQIQEVRDIADYLKETHRYIRQPSQTISVDIAALCREQLKVWQTPVQRAGGQIISFLPKSARVLGNLTDYNIAITSLLDALVQKHLHKGELRINLTKQGAEVVVEFALPHTVLTEDELRSLAAFDASGVLLETSSGKYSHELWKLQIAVCREILHKHHAQLEIHSHEGDGTYLRLHFLPGSLA